LGAGNAVDFMDDRHLSLAFANVVAVRVKIETRQSIRTPLKQTIQQSTGEADRAKSRPALCR
jgi:hypothetical protein